MSIDATSRFIHTTTIFFQTCPESSPHALVAVTMPTTGNFVEPVRIRLKCHYY